jgi:deazaflavin-dependent oxidoreductase (nitroreductase family)
MTASSPTTIASVHAGTPALRRAPRLGGLFWRLARTTSPLMLPLAGKRWNPIFAVLEHRGRRTGRLYAAPVAARRIRGGFVIALAFGAHVDWYRNVLAAGGATIHWRGHAFPATAPEPIDAALARAAFLPVQRALMGMAGIDGFVHLRDREAPQG